MVSVTEVMPARLCSRTMSLITVDICSIPAHFQTLSNSRRLSGARLPALSVTTGSQGVRYRDLAGSLVLFVILACCIGDWVVAEDAAQPGASDVLPAS